MKIFGKGFSEYVSFEKGFLILVLVVGLARLGLSLAGLPTATVKFVSLTVLLLLGLIYYSVRVHTSGFGSYMQLLPVIGAAGNSLQPNHNIGHHPGNSDWQRQHL
jgi:hypothetical protein